MKAEQYEAIKPLLAAQRRDSIAPVCMESISASELDNPGLDRTLLWGYTCDRDSFHVYLKDQLIHKVVYEHPNKLKEYVTAPSMTCESMAPDKSAYPSACDAQFVRLMLQKGQHVTYTTFIERDEAPFYGALREELTA